MKKNIHNKKSKMNVYLSWKALKSFRILDIANSYKIRMVLYWPRREEEASLVNHIKEELFRNV